MILLLEGPDGAGKSALAEAVTQYCRETGMSFSIWHAGPPEPPGRCPFSEYESCFDGGSEHYAWDPRSLLVLDRHHTGEALYGPLFRGRSRLSANGMYHVELALEAAGTVKLLVLPPLGTVMEWLKQRQDLSEHDKHFLDIQQLDAAWSWYCKYGYANGYILIHDGKADQSGLQLDLLRKAELAPAVHQLSGGTYIGSLSPELLVCGDIRGNGKLGRPDLIRPFTPTTAGGGSNYLLTALRSTEIAWKCGIVNINDSRVQPEIWDCLGKPAVAALGDKASAALSQLQVPHTRIPHPSWASRFKSGQEEWYADCLVKAAEGKTSE